MTTLDILICVVAGIAVIVGWRRGIIRQVGALGGVAAGILLCWFLGDTLAAAIAAHAAPAGEGAEASFWSGPMVCKITADIVLFAIGYFAVRIIAGFFRKAAKALALGFFDHLAGAAFMLLEWMIFVSLLLNLWLIIRPQTQLAALSTLFNGHLLPAIVALAPFLCNLL